MNSEDLDVRIHRNSDIPVVGLSGDIDSYTCSKLGKAIVNLITDGDLHVVIDMSEVKYIDSSGLGTLVGGLRRVHEQNGNLAITNPSPQIRRIMNLTGLNKVFTLYDNESEAITSLKS